MGPPRTPAVVASALLIAIGLAPGAARAAEPATLDCAVSEIITATNSSDEHRKLRQLLRVGRGVYQIWDWSVSGWGANLCDVSECSLAEGVLRLENHASTVEGGHRIVHQEQRTVDLRSGRAASQVTDSTTELPTAYTVETTTYDEGSCTPAHRQDR